MYLFQSVAIEMTPKQTTDEIDVVLISEFQTLEEIALVSNWTQRLSQGAFICSQKYPVVQPKLQA